jgi:very-short-patch-repair endonuclease
MPNFSTNLKSLNVKRKKLRNHSTSAEIVLWEHLKSRRLEGRKFRRQFSVGFYILDFYCPEEKLCIELDGQHHFTEDGKSKDAEREKHLEQCGIKTLRFENYLVRTNLENILLEIKNHFKK